MGFYHSAKDARCRGLLGSRTCRGWWLFLLVTPRGEDYWSCSTVSILVFGDGFDLVLTNLNRRGLEIR